MHSVSLNERSVFYELWQQHKQPKTMEINECRCLKSSSGIRKRVEQFNQLLKEDTINVKLLQKLCFEGVPEKPSLRSLAWKILLNYLPSNRQSWKAYLKKQRLIYKQYIEEIVTHPDNGDNEEKQLCDHPLNTEPDSQWKTYFKDNEVLLQIDRDVRRLCPDISFFQHPTSYSLYHFLGHYEPFETLTKRVERVMLESSVIGTTKLGVKNAQIKKKKTEMYTVLENGQEAHWQVVERILFIYAKLNPGLAYVQGMNEILGPIYYTFASDPDLNWQEHAEADSFFCFMNVMGDLRDNFIKMLDDSVHGIGHGMKNFFNLLKIKDPELWSDLHRKQMKPQFFAFRWITLLLSQEFYLPDVQRLWDSLFADPKRFEFLLYVCCSMTMLLREEILASDFARTMKILQNFPHDRFDMATVISKAVNLQNDIYSSNRTGISIQKTTNPPPRSGNFISKVGKLAWNNEK